MRPNSPIRRQLVFGAAGTALACVGVGAAIGAETDTIQLGQSVALSGPLADLGKAMHLGGKLCFDAINAKGGIRGKRIVLNALDDAYDLKKSQENLKQFFDNKSIFGLFTVMGTPMVDAAMAQVKESGMLMFSPFTGAVSARPAGVRNVLGIRAGYAEEAVQLVRHLSTIGISKVAFVTQNNGFGKEILIAATAAMSQVKNKAIALATIENNASDAVAAADKIAAAEAGAVVMGLAGKPSLEFIKAIRAKQPGLALYGLSVLGAAGTIKAMGNDGAGVTLTQVVPLPTRESIAVVRDFKSAFADAKVDVEASHLTLEGYINAKAFIAIASKAPGTITPKSFIDTAWSTKRFDLGGFELNFNEVGLAASRFIELTLISRSGGFVR